MQKQSLLFKFLLCLLFIVMIKTNSYAQTGLNFQGVARSSNNVIIASQQISLRLSILQGSATGSVEYSEARKVTTNAQGLFAVVIGDADATSTMGIFNTINWKNTPKYLKIEMDASAGNNYTTIGTTQFQYVAYAQFASSVDAENIVGVVPVARGGTGATNLTSFKSSLVLDKINNTSDADKPISTKTQTALDLKLNAADTSKYTKQSYTDAALLTKFNLADTGKYTKQSYTDAALLTKLNLADTGKYTKQVYTDSSLITKLKLSDTASMLSSRIGKDTLNLSARINAKANASDLSSGLALKADISDVATSLNSKLNKTDTSYLLQKADTAALSNRINLKANASEFNTSLALKANVSDVTTSLLSKLNKTDTSYLLQKADTATLSNRINLKANASDVITSLALKANASDLNTSLAIKASTLDLTTGLATKVEKVTGKELSTNDYSNAEKAKLAAITGTNTGDQDLSNYATNTALALKANTSDINTSLALKASITDVTTSLLLKEDASNKSSAVDLGGLTPSDILFPTQKAVKEYVAANNAAGGIADGSITSIKIADAAVNFQKLQTIPANTILGNTTSNQASLQAITTTGSDNVVLSTSPTLVSPNLGQATATSINNVSINTLNGTASITVRGETTLRGNNNGDDAPNQRYENILADGIVSLTTNQPIDGQKIFQNNLVMGNIGGLAGTSSPTTIDFANGSRIGDIQNIIEQNPDAAGSIDLYAPDGAKWVQLNYANRNYIAVADNTISFWVDDNEWEFNNFGITKIPYHTFLGGNLYFSQDGITENHNASIESNGPLLKIYARSETSQEDVADVDYGIQLNFADKSRIDLLDDFIVSSITDTANKQSSNFMHSKNSLSFDFFDEVNSYSNHWVFYGDDGSSSFPGEINVHNGDVDIYEGNLNLRQGKFKANGTFGTIGDILTIDNAGFPVWQAPAVSSGSGSIAGISSMNNLSDLSQILAVGTDGVDFNISSASGTHTFNIPDASTNKRGLLNSNDYTRFNNKQDAMDYVTDSRGGYLRAVDFNIFNNKQDALTNPITGIGTSGQLSFFNGTSSMTSSSNLFWNESDKRLGIGTNTPESPLHIKQGTYNEFGLLLTSPELPPSYIDPNPPAYGSSIGFVSNVGAGTVSNSGSFQLDVVGNMVFRTKQSGMYFDNFDGNGNGYISFRVGPEGGPYHGMNLDKDGNLQADGNVKSGSVILTSDLRLKKNIKPITNSLTTIQKLSPVSYEKKQSIQATDYTTIENGFIAQELQKILPDLVHESADKDKLLSVNYTAIIPILTKGIQEQQAIIEDQKKRLDALEKLVNELIKKQ